MQSKQGLPVIIGSGLSGMFISDWLTRAGIEHLMLGVPPNDLPRLGESIDPAGTLAMKKYYPEYEEFYYRKAWISVFLGDYAISCDFSIDFSRRAGLKILGFDAPPEFFHLDRVGFDKALFEKVSGSDYLSRYETLVDAIDYDPESDRIQALHLANGETIRPSYVFDCTNHVRLLGKALNIPLETISAPQKVVYNHFYADGDTPMCDSKDMEWLHSTNVLRLYEDIDGYNGLAWAIPLGQYISAGVSMPLGDNECSDDEVMQLLGEAYARRGLDYMAHFPHPRRLMSIPYQQYFFHERAYGKNWLLAGPSYGQVWFPSASGVGAALVAGTIAADIIQSPEEVGQLYQDYITGLRESHTIFDRMILRHHSEMTPELMKAEATRIVTENVKRVARLSTIQSGPLSANLARVVIKAVSREGVATTSCKVFQAEMGDQTHTIFADA